MSFWDYFTEPEYMLYSISMALVIPFVIFGIIASVSVNRTFAKYNKVPVSSGISAETYARNLLGANGVEGIQFAAIGGSLTDNFNPRTKIISLSETVQGASTAGAIGVACHEAGHAVQHAKKYFFSAARLKLVPIVNFANGWIWPIFICGYSISFTTVFRTAGDIILIIGLCVMGLSLLFSLVTLPTEFNASRRAYSYLKTCLLPAEAKGVRKVLTAAAMTYVSSFMLTSLQFLRILALLLINTKNRRK